MLQTKWNFGIVHLQKYLDKFPIWLSYMRSAPPLLHNVVTTNSINFYQRLLLRQFSLWMRQKRSCQTKSINDTCFRKLQHKMKTILRLELSKCWFKISRAPPSISFQILRFHFLPPTCTDWFCQKVQILKTGYYLVRIFMQSLPTPSNLLFPKFHYNLFLNLWKSIILHHIPHLTPLFCIKTKPDTPSSQVS